MRKIYPAGLLKGQRPRIKSTNVQSSKRGKPRPHKR